MIDGRATVVHGPLCRGAGAACGQQCTGRRCPTGKFNYEIATSLVVVVSTVKAHINSIFGKLGVTRRTQALVCTRELQLL